MIKHLGIKNVIKITPEPSFISIQEQTQSQIKITWELIFYYKDDNND